MARSIHPAPMIAALAAAIVVAAAPVIAGSEVTPLVSTEWLAEHLGDDDLVIVDVRGEDDFAAGHVPGAVRTDFPGAWRGPKGVVPPIAETEAHLSALGVSNDTTMAIVSAGTGATEFGIPARIYWAMKYLGHDAVAILDGGWAAWTAGDANPVSTGASTPTPATFVADPRPELLATTAEVAGKVGTDTVLIDARPLEQYLGETMDGSVARAGHIPGAISVPNASFYDTAANRLKPVDQLASPIPDLLRQDKGADIVAYCNTGWWSATNWFVLHEMLGYDNASLYVESMAGWTADPANPIETGSGPAD